MDEQVFSVGLLVVSVLAFAVIFYNKLRVNSAEAGLSYANFLSISKYTRLAEAERLLGGKAQIAIGNEDEGEFTWEEYSPGPEGEYRKFITLCYKKKRVSSKEQLNLGPLSKVAVDKEFYNTAIERKELRSLTSYKKAVKAFNCEGQILRALFDMQVVDYIWHDKFIVGSLKDKRNKYVILSIVSVSMGKRMKTMLRGFETSENFNS